jgi:hypothetical protein
MERFAEKYVELGYNATRACEAAGYRGGNLQVRGSRLLATPEVKARVQQLIEAASKASALTAERVLSKFAAILDADVRCLFDDQGNLKPIHTLGDKEASIIQSFDVCKGNLSGSDGTLDSIARVRLVDRAPIYNLLAKHLKIVTNEPSNVNVSLTLVSNRLQAARKRIASSPPLIQAN